MAAWPGRRPGRRSGRFQRPSASALQRPDDISVPCAGNHEPTSPARNRSASLPGRAAPGQRRGRVRARWGAIRRTLLQGCQLLAYRRRRGCRPQLSCCLPGPVPPDNSQRGAIKELYYGPRRAVALATAQARCSAARAATQQGRWAPLGLPELGAGGLKPRGVHVEPGRAREGVAHARCVRHAIHGVRRPSATPCCARLTARCPCGACGADAFVRPCAECVALLRRCTPTHTRESHEPLGCVAHGLADVPGRHRP